jgi:hypothetical protein
VQILLTHIVKGAYRAHELRDGQLLETLDGTTLTVTLYNGVVTLTAPNNGTAATVTLADIKACKSVVHVIDTVLIPGGVDFELPAVTPADTPAQTPVAPIGALDPELPNTPGDVPAYAPTSISLTPDPSCGDADQPCCSQAADGAACESGLVCDRNVASDETDDICTPCGALGQLACNPNDRALPSFVGAVQLLSGHATG